MNEGFSAKKLDQVLQKFTELAPWNQFDEWSGICIEIQNELVCAFFGEGADEDFRLLILRGPDPAHRYLQYRNSEWTPEFGLDFATTDGLKLSVIDEQVSGYSSDRPGHPSEELRLDETQMLLEVLEAINSLVGLIESEKVPLLGESEEFCYSVWKVGSTWRADIKEFPDEKFVRYPAIQVNPERIKRMKVAGLLQEGIWEATPFFLPVTRFQGDQEVYVQCAGVAERGMGLLGLVTLEAHADPEHELVEAILGSIENQKRMPQFIVVKEEKVAERILPIIHPLGIQLRLRRNLRELERIRDEMIDDFPEDEDNEDR